MKGFYTLILQIGELAGELCLFFSGVKSPAAPPQFLSYQLVINLQQRCEFALTPSSAPCADLFGVYLHEAPLANYAKGVSRFTP